MCRNRNRALIIDVEVRVAIEETAAATVIYSVHNYLNLTRQRGHFLNPLVSYLFHMSVCEEGSLKKKFGKGRVLRGAGTWMDVLSVTLDMGQSDFFPAREASR